MNTPNTHSQVATQHKFPSAAGYYIQTSDGKFYQIDQYIVRNGELGLNKLAGVKHIPISSKSDLEDAYIVINTSGGFDLQRYAPRFYSQSAAIINPDYVYALNAHPEQIDDDLFAVGIRELNPGDIITIADNNSVYAIGLGEISTNIARILSEVDWEDSTVAQRLEEALRSFPGNKELEQLLEKKAAGRVFEKLSKVIADAEQRYKVFQSAEKHASKLVHADNVLDEIQYYEAIAAEAGIQTLDSRIVELRAEMEAFKAKPVEAVVLPELDRSKLSSLVAYYASSQASVGAGSIVVAMVAVGEEDLLVRFTGIGNEFEGKVLRARKEITNSSTHTFIAKTTEVTGSNWNLVMYENDGWGTASYSTYPPAINNKVSLYQIKSDNQNDTSDKLFDDYTAAAPATRTSSAPASNSELSW